MLLTQWYYDVYEAGILLLVAQVEDSEKSEIPSGSTMVLLNEQDEPGILNLKFPHYSRINCKS